ncbi:FtsW/RodA/SpoVE family cell cycle protein [Alicyclobacillus mengziensis]|uniref:Rod shape-determining protein RodA n=1 Tax=Alicyclobacillus mengziensis TaxID=2931921 RepID=A0A9X7W468_9BACL|nr:FtsW/RodA/SpoVE family cell cycle protein [Alicyclobacillus mengziensis]QSO50084.1 rod shape-determining protein RodA [Alicyclobacillus mengziensis]
MVLKNWKRIDFVLIGTCILLSIVSCIAVYAATYGKVSPLIPTHAWVKQMVYGIIGFVAMLFFAFQFDYRSLRKLHWWLYGGTTFLLVAVFAFHPINGARSWIPLPGFTVQPSEFAKLTLIFTLAALMAKVDEAEYPDYRIRKTLPLWILTIVPFALTLKEPALGQAIVMFAIFFTMYVLFLRRAWFISSVVIFVAFCVVFIALPVEFPATALNFLQNVVIKHHLLHGYQADRILTWLNPSYQISGAGYEIHQAQIAIGSGQVFGEGWLRGVETSTGGVPNQWTDYIFTAPAEEFGFLGSSIIILLFLVLVYRLVRAASLSGDTFGAYIIIGIVALFSFQVFENIGMDMYLSPSTGITLPFISYGGSSVLANYIAVGLAINVTLQSRKLRLAQSYSSS